MQSNVWDDIVLGSNENGGKLSGANYVKAIYLESTINGSFPGDNYLGVIISGQLFCEAIVWASIFFFFWGGGEGNYPRGNCPGAVVLGAIIPGGKLSCSLKRTLVFSLVLALSSCGNNL